MSDPTAATELANLRALRSKIEQARTFFGTNYENWPSMTAQQKDAANRQAQRALSNICQHLLNDYSSEGSE
jgi:regulator of sigma D